MLDPRVELRCALDPMFTGSSCIGMARSFQSVGQANQTERMYLLGTRFALRLDPLKDGAARDRAVRADVIRIVLRHLTKHRPTDLHRGLEIFSLDSPRAVVT